MNDNSNPTTDEAAIDEVDVGQAATVPELISAGEIAEAVITLDRMSMGEQTEVVADLSPEDAAELVEHVVDLSAVELMERLPTDVAASILHEVSSDYRADLLAGLQQDKSDAIIEQMEPADADDTRKLLEYDRDTAGGLMGTELVRFQAHQRVSDVIDDFSQKADEYRDYEVQYSFVCEGERLVGVLSLRDLVLSSRIASVRDIMIGNPISVPVDATLDQLDDFFDSHAFLGVPVVNEGGDLLGIVQRLAVENARSDQERSDYLKSQGIVGGEEVRSLPLIDRSRRRLSWLSVNIILNIMAASVIAFFQDTLQSVIALAVFLPIISDMSGCSGNQAVAVSMRELSLGLIKPHEMGRVWLKEITLGMVNGASLGLLIAAAAMLWKGDVMLGFVVGAALCLNTMIAVSFGGMVPLILKRFGVDPAIASGPLLTTITDMCGFFLVLGLASILLV